MVIAYDGGASAPISSEWALGDYHRFAKMALWDFGPKLVAACDIRPGLRVLDVGTGTGNTAIPAALAGAEVIASDITTENFPAGRAEAAACGARLDWVRGDAQRLPFSDHTFDVVTSSVGAIFAPRHQDVADELVRVTKPGGTIGMICWTRRSWVCEILATLAHYDPPAPDALPVRLWGDPEHVRSLFGDRLATLSYTTHGYTRGAATPVEFADFFMTTFGPIQAAFEAVRDRPGRTAALRRDLYDLARRHDVGTAGAAAFRFEYLLLVATTAV
ncbi:MULTISPECIES: class I SAM-dependent methyltransferase [unclassified Nocardia]|uniref:class I SAM-dependent methyltransferase n=1 Tax=unclassified Nocardia TaxID=2637762 RepID=UPI001CE3D2C2|nr:MULTISPECIES: class I SAM-dependent methyltransferase [unclassified Nocardia]